MKNIQHVASQGILYVVALLIRIVFVFSGLFSSSNKTSRISGKKQKIVISLVGDSLSTSFYVSNLFHTIWLSHTHHYPNWFSSGSDVKKNNEVTSLIDLLSEEYDTVFYNFATATADVDFFERKSPATIALKADQFSHQVSRISKLSRLPEIVLIWLGHNSLDWVERAGGCDFECIRDSLVEDFIRKYEAQLSRLIELYECKNIIGTIVLYKLINFETFFKAREEAELIHQTSGKYPHLVDCYKYFSSMEVKDRDKMIDLATCFNDALAELVQTFDGHRSNQKTKVVLSDALHNSDINRAKYLNGNDAWHPSNEAHNLFASEVFRDLKKLSVI